MIQIAFGTRVRDVVTQQEGIISGRTEWMNGCVQYIVSPGLDKDGKRQDMLWIDWQQLEVLDPGVSAHIAKAKAADAGRSGGPSPFAKLPNGSQR